MPKNHDKAFNLKGLRPVYCIALRGRAAYLYANVDCQSTRPDACRRREQPRRVQPRAPVVVGLVQINNSFSGQNYLPYSVALLQTYVQKMSADAGRYVFLPPLYKRVRIADAVEALKDADLVGFSTYVWNGRISLEIARRLKAAEARHRHRLRRPARARPAGGLPAGQSARSTSPSTTRASARS